MFCIHCGKEIPDGSRFCQYCGGNCTSTDQECPQTSGGTSTNNGTVSPGATQETYTGVPCPHCGSECTKPLVHTRTQLKAGGYSCCAGACGGFLLGPLGLLLGLCGKSSSIDSSSQTKWVCLQCGTEFLSKQDAKRTVDTMILGITFFAQVALFMLPLGSIFLALAIASAGCAVICGLALQPEQLIYRFDQLMTPLEFADWKRRWFYINLGIAVGIVVFWMLILL